MGISEELENLKQMSQKARDQAVETEDVIRSEMEAIRTKVKAGESTGDRLRDLALIKYADDAEGKIYKIFTDIEASLAGKKGQLFLIAERSHQYHDSSEHEIGGCSDLSTRKPDVATLGFLSDDKLVVDAQAGHWMIPCREYIRGEARYEGPATFSDQTAETSYMLRKWGHPSNTPAPLLVFGDDEVLGEIAQDVSVCESRNVTEQLLLMMTLDLQLPEGHRFVAMRSELRDQALKSALNHERFIANNRFSIEGSDKMDSSGIVSFVKDIRVFIREMRKNIELAVKLGIDPNRSEILRLKERFGHYWQD